MNRIYFPTRRAFLGVTASVLSGCGFALRGAVSLSFHSLYLEAQPTQLVRILRRRLENIDDLRIIDDPQKKAQAEVILILQPEQRESVIVGRNSSGGISEVQLKLSVRFRVLTGGGAELLPETLLQRQTDQSDSESAALSKAAEAETVYQTMLDDIIEQLLRRLTNVRVPQSS